VEPELELKQFWMAGAEAKKFQMVEPEILVPVQQTEFVMQVICTKKTIVFSFYWTKSFWSRSQKLLRGLIRSQKTWRPGAGARNWSSGSTGLVNTVP